MQFWRCPAVGHLYPTFRPHHGTFAAFPKQNDNVRQMPGGVGGKGMGTLGID